VTSPTKHHRGGHFDHRALIVDADDTIQRILVPQLRQWIRANQAVLMVVGADTEAIIRHGLGPDAYVLQWAPVNTSSRSSTSSPSPM
jgi:hypothetical protein